jgi:tRNA dimethylallyltransferase
MWEAGLRDETNLLLKRGLRDGFTASRAIGYSQAIAVIDGDLTEQQARLDTAQATRRYARRQESWFRADPRIVWLQADSADLVDEALSLVRQAGTANQPDGIPENG